MTRTELARKIRKPGETVELNMHNPLHYSWVMGMYHGEETVSLSLPLLYSAISNTVMQAPAPLSQGRDFSSGAEVEGVHWNLNNNRLTVRAVTSLQNTAMFIDEYLEIRTSAGESVDGYARTTNDSHHTVLTFETGFDPSEFSSHDLEIDYSVTWADAANGPVRALMSSRDIKRDVYFNTAVKQVHLYDPVKKKEGTSAPINIVYNREILKTDVDYNYQSSFNPSTGKQKLFAPLSAWVEFQPDSNEEFDHIDISSFQLKMDCQSGISKYTKTGREESISAHFTAQPDESAAHPNGFSFKLDPQWLDDVPSARWPVRDRVDFYFSVNYVLKSGKLGTIQIGSDLDKSAVDDAGSVEAGWLNLLWGCLAPGTRILMADGSEKPVEEICIGERVLMDGNGNCATVEDTLTGNEPRNMVRFQMLGGRELTCTRDHAIVTNMGIMKAEDVHGNCRMCTPDNSYVGLIGIWDVPGDKIYNLVLKPEGASDIPENGCTMFAEGILVGDNTMQGYVGKQKTVNEAPNIYLEESDMKRRIWGNKL